MDAFESNRRDFLKKLGLIAGATALTASGFSEVTDLIMEKGDMPVLTPEQSKFMVKYEKWLKEFHEMAKYQKIDREHIGNSKKLMSLSKEAENWQKDLIEYMKDDNFARNYMAITEKVTRIIE